MTNADLHDLIEAGVAESAILAKIRKSPTDFDLSIDALVELKERNISSNILGTTLESRSGLFSNFASNKITKRPKNNSLERAANSTKDLLRFG